MSSEPEQPKGSAVRANFIKIEYGHNHRDSESVGIVHHSRSGILHVANLKLSSREFCDGNQTMKHIHRVICVTKHVRERMCQHYSHITSTFTVISSVPNSIYFNLQYLYRRSWFMNVL